MKLLTLLFTIIPVLSFSQVINSVNDGNYYNPTTWDCNCIPGSDDSVRVLHNVSIYYGIYFDSGSLTVLGELSDGTLDLGIWMDSTSALYNEGTINCQAIRFSKNVTATSTNGLIHADSIWNEGQFISDGDIEVIDLLNDSIAFLQNAGNLTITNDFLNRGEMHNTGYTSVQQDFANCGTSSSDYALLFNEGGYFCVLNDVLNCEYDTISGGYGAHYFFGGASGNNGVIDLYAPTMNISTPSGNLTLPGTINPNITMSVSNSCSLSLTELEASTIHISPNPASSHIRTNLNNFKYSITDQLGKQVSSGYSEHGEINIQTLEPGIYHLRPENAFPLKFIKY